MRVADYTSPRQSPLNLRVSYNSASDLLAALWILGDRRSGCAIEDLSLGDEWFAEFEQSLSPDTIHQLDEIGSGDVWIALMPLLPETQAGGTVDDFIKLLAAMDAADLRYRLIQVHDKYLASQQELLADAAEGDAAAIEELVSTSELDSPDLKQWRDTLQYLLMMDPDETRNLLVDVLRRAQDEAFAPHEASFRPYLDADYRSKRAMARRVSPERLLEIATSGINFTDERAYKPIVLMPTMVARPWVVFAAGPDFFLLGYPVSDEILEQDDDAPPQWLVKLHKALGDERRLRVLRSLADGDASLAELADRHDIAKSTLHHHLMLLRSAGLVRLHVGTEKRYSLREETLGDASAALDHYLHTTESPGAET
ncbi:MAG: metalloregulator ArsR/SmtB family transcription factor [Acidimicrobiia bacterium]|nr:metalloregulator ArsR/SmtB family transcription factor [Acidimicrobiia bacterium]